MGFHYSPSTGLIEKLSAYHDTADEAYLHFYLMESTNLIKQKNDAEKKLKYIDEQLDKLNEDFDWLKDKYPEELL